LRPLAGTNGTQSGGNSQAPADSLNPAIAPVRISSNRDAINLVSLGNRFTEFENNAGSAGIIDAATKISNKKLDVIDRRSLPEKIRQLIACSFQQTNEQLSKLSENAVSTDGANADPQIQTAFQNVTSS